MKLIGFVLLLSTTAALGETITISLTQPEIQTLIASAQKHGEGLCLTQQAEADSKVLFDRINTTFNPTSKPIGDPNAKATSPSPTENVKTNSADDKVNGK